jgi:hypothetical protein
MGDLALNLRRNLVGINRDVTAKFLGVFLKIDSLNNR